MADRRDRSLGEQPRPAGLASRMAQENKDEHIVSSSTSMDPDREREEDMETESLPQTYQASPPLLPHSSHRDLDNLPHTPHTATVYTSIAQQSYGDPSIPMTYTTVPHHSYLVTDVISTDNASEKITYVSGSMPLGSVDSTVLAPMDYDLASQPIDFRRSNVSQAREAGIVSTVNSRDSVRNSVLDEDSGRVDFVQAHQVARRSVPQAGNLDRLSLPQIADVSGMTVSSAGVQSVLFNTTDINRLGSGGISAVSRVSTLEPQTGLLTLPVSEGAHKLNEVIAGNVNASRVTDSKAHVRNTTRNDQVNRTMNRLNSPDTGELSRMHFTNMSALDSSKTVDLDKMMTSGSDKITWINIPLGGHSASYSESMAKMNLAQESDVSRLTAPSSNNMGTIQMADSVKEGRLDGHDTGTVLAQVEDFSRLAGPSSSSLVGMARSEEANLVEGAASGSTGMHVLDIKYSNLLARSGLADMARIGALQTHESGDPVETRLSVSHLQEPAEMDTQSAVDTKPIILPQDAGVSIVAYPDAGEDVNALAMSQAGNISMIILPQTSDVGQVNFVESDGRKMDYLPAVDSDLSRMQAIDGTGMNIQHNGNIIRINLPAPGDMSRLSIPQADGSIVQVQPADVNRMMLPHTSGVQAGELEHKVDLSKMMALQSGDTGTTDIKLKTGIIVPQQTETLPGMPETSGANTGESHQMYYVSRSDFVAGDSTFENQHRYELARGSVSHASDPVTLNTAMYEVARASVSQPAQFSTGDRQLYVTPKTTVSQTYDSSASDRQAAYGVGSARLDQLEDVRIVGKQVFDIGRAEFTQLDDKKALGAVGKHRSGQLITDVSKMRAEQTDSKTAIAQFTDPNMMTLPQTSDIRYVTVPVSVTEDSAVSGQARQPAPLEVNRASVSGQPHPEYINMRVMAEAAEFISRRTSPADDINMRLMAETADFVSRNVPQTSVISNAGDTQKTQNTSAKTTTGRVDKTTFKVPSNATTVEGVSKGNKGQPVISKKDFIKSANEPQSAFLKKTPTSDSGSVYKLKTILGKTATTAVAGEKTTVERGKSTAAGNDTGKPRGELVNAGFKPEFINSPSYARWRNIGSSRGLHTNEEIACFLVKYYDNTFKLFPAGSSACSVCQNQLSVSCIHCSQNTAGDGIKDTSKDTKTEKRTGTDRNKVWQLIREAGSKDRRGDKSKENKTEKHHRRKPFQTRRVLRRRVIVSPSKSSSDDSTGEQVAKNSADKPALPAEEKPQTTPSPMVTRKRGRPSNDSYQQASTLECSGCKRKFHTPLGLDQHVKRKRCKAAKTETPDLTKESGKQSDPTHASFHFQCADCDKSYRSKQGLLLHRTAKHDEVNKNLESALTDEEEKEEEDTDYVPSQEDKTSTLFECPVCHKEYRSKQGMLSHKATKHPDQNQTDLETEEEREEHSNETKSREESVATIDLSALKGLTSFECEECNKKYTSRPGYLLHMKTKHAPLVLLDCSDCEEKFKTKVELRIHFRKQHSNGRLVLFCPYCPSTFHDRDVLKGHMDESHKTCRRVLFDCFACDLQFSSRIERKRHIQSEHKGKDTSLTCHFCGSWFATRFEYDQHEKEGHPDQSQEWLCAICGDAFPTRYLLQRHALSHKEKIHCELCNKYITEPCFEDHMKRHYGNKTWKCEICSKAFIRKAELQQHTLVHKNERPFCCELCGMRYREKSRLNSHMRTHTGVKPYKCTQCEKRFTRSRELKNHLRVHTGEKPFSCNVCGRKFASSGNLSAHRRKVHKLEPIPHGQQSRKHTLEESIKPENKLPQPVAGPQVSQLPTYTNVPLEIPMAHSGASLEVHVDHNISPMEAPVAHSTPLTLQAPAAHQAPVAHQAPIAHQDAGVVYQQHVIPKYEPLVTQSDHYDPQPVIQQPQASVQIHWPNAAYGEES